MRSLFILSVAFFLIPQYFNFAQERKKPENLLIDVRNLIKTFEAKSKRNADECLKEIDRIKKENPDSPDRTKKVAQLKEAYEIFKQKHDHLVEAEKAWDQLRLSRAETKYLSDTLSELFGALSQNMENLEKTRKEIIQKEKDAPATPRRAETLDTLMRLAVKGVARIEAKLIDFVIFPQRWLEDRPFEGKGFGTYNDGEKIRGLAKLVGWTKRGYLDKLVFYTDSDSGQLGRVIPVRDLAFGVDNLLQSDDFKKIGEFHRVNRRELAGTRGFLVNSEGKNTHEVDYNNDYFITAAEKEGRFLNVHVYYVALRGVGSLFDMPPRNYETNWNEKTDFTVEFDRDGNPLAVWYYHKRQSWRNRNLNGSPATIDQLSANFDE